MPGSKDSTNWKTGNQTMFGSTDNFLRQDWNPSDVSSKVLSVGGLKAEQDEIEVIEFK